jgi:uncharacterized protein (TIGR02266 family)
MAGVAPDVETTIERRLSRRAPVTVRINYGTIDALFSEFTRDINDGGVFVSTDQPLPVDELVVLQFRLPGSQAGIQARGRVVRVEPPKNGSPGGMAIEFEKLDAAAQAEIDRLIRELRSE